MDKFVESMMMEQPLGIPGQLPCDAVEPPPSGPLYTMANTSVERISKESVC